MKHRINHLLVLVVLISVSTASFADSTAPIQYDHDAPYAGELEGFGEKYSSYIPQVGDQEFKMARAGVSTRFSLGCSGIPQYGAVANVGAEVERVFDYLKRNALGLSINYLVYRNPTLYSFLQNLNQKHSFLTQQMMSSCSSIRQTASRHREGEKATNYESDAMDQCLANGHTAEYCSLGTNLVSGAVDAQKDEQEQRDRAAGVSNASSQDVILNRMAKPTRETKDVSGESFAHVIRDITSSQKIGANSGGGSGGAAGAGTAGGGVNTTGPGGSSSSSNLGDSLEAPDSSIEDKVTQMTQDFAKKYQSVISSAADQSLTSNKDYAELNREPGIPVLSGRSVQDLYKLSQNDPTQYVQVVGTLSRESAIVSMRHILDKYEVALRDAQVTTDEALSKEEWQRKMNELKYLRAQVNMIDNQSKYQQHLLKIVQDARDAS